MVRADDGEWGFPPPGGMLTGPFVWDAQTARRIPGVARCLQLYSGLVRQMEMDCFRGLTQLPTPGILRRPDPNRPRSWFVGNSIEDYLLNGNAIAYVTSRGSDGWPLTVLWLPASWVYVQWFSPVAPEDEVTYFYQGVALDPENVVHVRRGADRTYPVRGVGIVEEHLGSLDRIAQEEAYEASTLQGSAVPSVAIITPQSVLTQDEADQAKAGWVAKFGGPVREPAILPNGTQVIPLAWSPSDAQLIQARMMSLTDIANMFNVDGYWLGAPVSGMTYRTAAPQYQTMLRTSLEPILSDFEDEWSNDWLPRGQRVQFERNKLLRDDLPTTITAMAAAVAAGLMSVPEARAYMGLPTSTPALPDSEPTPEVPEIGGSE